MADNGIGLAGLAGGFGGPGVLRMALGVGDEAENVDALYARTRDALDALDLDWELVCVDDGSRDDSLARLIALHRQDPRIKVLELSRNFGKELALTAGIDAASGDAVVPIDADLQDPPELIADMVAKWREGYDVVYALRLVACEDPQDLLARTADAGQMGRNRYSLLLDPVDSRKGIALGGAAGTVGHRKIGRIVRVESHHGFV